MKCGVCGRVVRVNPGADHSDDHPDHTDAELGPLRARLEAAAEPLWFLALAFLADVPAVIVKAS